MTKLKHYDPKLKCEYSEVPCGKPANVIVRLHYWDYIEEQNLCGKHKNYLTDMCFVLNMKYWTAEEEMYGSSLPSPWWTEQTVIYI